MKMLKGLLLVTVLITITGFDRNIENEISYVSNSEFNAMGPYLSVDNNQEHILNWTEEIDENKTSVLKYRIFDTNQQQFKKEVVVTSSKGLQSHHESMPKVAKTESGVMYAVFRFTTPNSKNRFAGSIYYAVSEDGGVHWTEKKKLVDDAQALSQSFYDLALLPDGELGLTWLDSRKVEKDKSGSTLYFAKTDHSNEFVNQKPIANYTCQCCRTDIYVDVNKKVHIAFRNIENESIRDMYQVVSSNDGQSFSKPEKLGEDNWKIEGCPHTGPSLGSTTNDVSVAWFTGANSGIGIFYKKLSDHMSLFNNKQLITTSGRHPQMVMSADGTAYIVYEDYVKDGDVSYTSIILHAVFKDGSTTKKELSLPKTNNDHAVISKLNSQQILVAWTYVMNKQSKVVYKIVDL